MSKKLLRCLMLVSILIFSSSVGLWAQDDSVEWSEVQVEGDQVTLDMIPDGVVNLKLVGTMNKFDFTLISRKIQATLERIDLSGLTAIDGKSSDVDFPAKALRELPHLNEVTLPACVSTMFGASFLDSESIKKIILTNPNMGTCDYGDGLCYFWGFPGRGKDECQSITLEVPKGSLQHYQNTAPWNNFTIVEKQGSSQNVAETVKMSLTQYGVSSISITDKTTGILLNDEVTYSKYIDVEKDHVIEVNAKGKSGRSLVKSYLQEDGGDKVDITALPYEFTVGSKDIELNITFDKVLTYKVRSGEGSLKAEIVEDDGYMQYDIKSGGVFGEPEQIIFTATPAEGSKVKAWYKNGELQDNKTDKFVVAYPNKSFNVEVEFEKATSAKMVAVTVKARNAKNYTLKDKVTGQTLVRQDGQADVYQAAQGQIIILNAEAETGFDFDNAHYQYKYLGDLHKIAELPAEIPVTDRDLDIVVNFNALVTYEVKGKLGGTLKSVVIEEDEYGDEDEIAVASGQSFNGPKNFVFTAYPEDGYKVKAWYKNGELQEKMTGLKYHVNDAVYSLNVQVEFVKDTKLLNVELKADPSIAVDKEGLKIYKKSLEQVEYQSLESLNVQIEEGASVKFEVKPKSGYQFVGFFVAEEKKEAEGDDEHGYTFIHHNLTEQMTVVARFLPVLTYSVFSKNGVIEVRVDENVVESGVGIEPGKQVVFKAIPRDRHRVKRWIINGVDKKKADSDELFTDRHITIEMTQQPLDVVVEYEKTPVKKFEVFASVDDENLGTIFMHNLSVNPKVQVKNGEMVDDGTGIEFEVALHENAKLDYWMINGVKNEDVEGDVIRIRVDDEHCKDGKLEVKAHLVSTVGVSEINQDLIVKAIGNMIVICGNAAMEYAVVSMNGTKIEQGIMAANEMSIKVPSGAYIVMVGGRTYKVVVQ